MSCRARTLRTLDASHTALHYDHHRCYPARQVLFMARMSLTRLCETRLVFAGLRMWLQPAHLMCSAPNSARTRAGTSTGGTCPYSSAVRMRDNAAAADRPFSRLDRCVYSIDKGILYILKNHPRIVRSGTQPAGLLRMSDWLVQEGIAGCPLGYVHAASTCTTLILMISTSCKRLAWVFAPSCK